MGWSQKIGIICFGLILISITYFTPRHESLLLLSQFTVLFGFYLFLSLSKEKISLKEITGIAIVFRLLLFFLIPNLSEDVYRFIWDGKMWLSGLDAYAILPTQAVDQSLPLLTNSLFNQLNSPGYFSIYPPINQLIFYVAALADNTTASIIIIRVFILAAEIATLLLLPKVLMLFGRPAKDIVWYAFNPLIILELSGSLHFEAFVICFAILACFYFQSQHHHKSALALGMAIAFKLIPIILLASVFKKLSLKKWLTYCLLSGLVVGATLTPFMFSDALMGMMESSTLYFKSFEFNASIYYIVRATGYYWKGYNIIATAGPLMGVLSFSAILTYNITVNKQVSFAERFMWTWFIYCLFATTLHPWYGLPLLTFGIISGYKFPIFWSFLIFFTYIGYTQTGFTENLTVTFLEYILLFIFIVIEVIQKRKTSFKLTYK